MVISLLEGAWFLLLSLDGGTVSARSSWGIGLLNETPLARGACHRPPLTTHCPPPITHRCSHSCMYKLTRLRSGSTWCRDDRNPVSYNCIECYLLTFVCWFTSSKLPTSSSLINQNCSRNVKFDWSTTTKDLTGRNVYVDLIWKSR